ncbi:sel1 repeat family protein [Shimia sediminis]|uniref:sel1 repeat family protein n=1 Tax=Shimia sediminis TaxID=2497945 RepID=UPI000F8EF784|nr:sel1 repeat family protein [Shimia sediminis]
MKKLSWVVAILATMANAANAEISKFWQEVSKEPRELARAACNNGETAARDRLYDMAFNDLNPAAMHSWAWMISGPECAFHTGEGPEVSQIYLHASEYNFPASLMVTGFRFLQGYHAEKNVERGLTFITRAVNGGYGMAAIHAANAYIDGKYVARDLDEADYWLMLARDTGAPQMHIDRVEDRLAALRPKAEDEPKDLLTLMQEWGIDPDKVAEEAIDGMLQENSSDTSSDGFEWSATAEVRLNNLSRDMGFDAKSVHAIVTGYVDGGPERCFEVDWVRNPQPGKLCFDLFCPGRAQVLSFDTAFFEVSGPAESCKW